LHRRLELEAVHLKGCRSHLEPVHMRGCRRQLEPISPLVLSCRRQLELTLGHPMITPHQ
jgi:hypothetical protein